MVTLPWVGAIKELKTFMAIPFGSINKVLEAGDYSRSRLTRSMLPLVIFDLQSDLRLQIIGSSVTSSLTYRIWYLADIPLTDIEIKLKKFKTITDKDPTIDFLFTGSLVRSIDAYLAEEEPALVLPFNSGFNQGSLVVELSIREGIWT